MKRRQILYRCLASLLMSSVASLLSGCSTAQEEIPQRVPLEVHADIAEPTKAVTPGDFDGTNYDKQSFVTNDKIEIQKESGSFVSYTKNSNGGWIPTDNSDGLTAIAGENFTASYPVGFSQILSAQNTAVNFWASNRLTSSATATGNRVNFVFAPAAAKITIVIEYSGQVTANGTSIHGTGILTGSATEETVSMLRTSAAGAQKRHSYACIVYPGQHTYTITVNDSSAGSKDGGTYTQTTKKLEAGWNYLYTFTSSSGLILSGIEVLPFTATGTTDMGSAT